MSSIISRYILKETAQTWVVVTMVLLLILLTNQFAQVLGDAAANKLPREMLFRVMGLTSLQYLTILIPIGLFLSIMLALGRLYHDSEMAALMACGIGPAALYKPLALLSVVLALLAGWLSLSVAPGAVRQIQIIAEEARQRVDLRFLEAGRFITFADADAVMYAESVNAADVLENVFVQRHKGAEIEVIVARRAWQSESPDAAVKILMFADGRRYAGRPGSAEFEIVSFEEYGMPFALPAAGPPQLKPESKPLLDLLGTGDPADRAEIQWRLSVPLALFVLTFLAVPLSRSAPRQGRYGGIAVGVLVYIIYVDMLGAAKVWVETEQTPEFLGLWWVHIVFVAAGAILLARQFGYRGRFTLRRKARMRS